jgi:hypothetical protein
MNKEERIELYKKIDEMVTIKNKRPLIAALRYCFGHRTIGEPTEERMKLIIKFYEANRKILLKGTQTFFNFILSEFLENALPVNKKTLEIFAVGEEGDEQFYLKNYETRKDELETGEAVQNVLFNAVGIGCIKDIEKNITKKARK